MPKSGSRNEDLVRCGKCKAWKQSHEMVPLKSRGTISTRCKACANAISQAWKKANPHKVAESRRKWRGKDALNRAKWRRAEKLAHVRLAALHPEDYRALLAAARTEVDGLELLGTQKVPTHQRFVFGAPYET